MWLICLKGEYTESNVLELPPLFLSCKHEQWRAFWLFYPELLSLLCERQTVVVGVVLIYIFIYTVLSTHCTQLLLEGREVHTHRWKQAYGGTEKLPSVQEWRGAQKGASKECQNIVCYCFIFWSLRLNSLHIKKLFFAISGSWFRPSGQSSGPFPLQIWFPDRIHSEELESHSVVTQGASICHSIFIFHCPFFCVFSDKGPWWLKYRSKHQPKAGQKKREEKKSKNTYHWA